MEANSFNAVYGSCFRAGNFSGSPLRHRRLQAATSRCPIAFDRRACRLIAVSL